MFGASDGTSEYIEKVDEWQRLSDPPCLIITEPAMYKQYSSYIPDNIISVKNEQILFILADTAKLFGLPTTKMFLDRLKWNETMAKRKRRDYYLQM